MTVAENKLHEVARALAEAVPDASIPPLRLPPSQHRARPSTWFVPLAAVMALIAGLVWTACVTGPRIIQNGGTTTQLGGRDTLVSRGPAAPSASPSRAFVPLTLVASPDPVLSVTRSIKGPWRRSIVDPVLSASAASVPDSVEYSAGATCTRRTAGRLDVCTVEAWMVGA